MNINGDYYKHIKWRDICVVPYKIFYIKEEKSYEVKFLYYSIYMGRMEKMLPVCLNIRDKMFIPQEKMKDWKIYKPNYLKEVK